MTDMPYIEVNVTSLAAGATTSAITVSSTKMSPRELLNVVLPRITRILISSTAERKEGSNRRAFDESLIHNWSMLATAAAVPGSPTRRAAGSMTYEVLVNTSGLIPGPGGLIDMQLTPAYSPGSPSVSALVTNQLPTAPLAQERPADPARAPPRAT